MRISDLFPAKRELKPDLEVGGVADLDVDSLHRSGVRAVGFDADQTLCAFGGPGIDATLQASIDAMVERFEGKVCVISNCTEERRRELEERFPLPVIAARRKKPARQPYRDAERRFNVPPERWAFVGDRLLTDVVGANRAGWRSILIRPLAPETDPPIIAAVRAYERALRRAYGV